MQAATAAVWRLVEVARSDTGQSRRTANVLLAWWNAGAHGGFDLTGLWVMDLSLAQDMATVFVLVSQVHVYPDSLDPALGEAMRQLVQQWRPPKPTPVTAD